MRLYLMRHAEAVPRGTPGHGRDAQRPLTPEGRLEARDVARGFKRLKLPLQLILASPYTRAAQTAEEVAKLFKPVVEVKTMMELRAEVSPDETSLALRAFNAYDHVMLVGHEPHLSAWIEELVTDHGIMHCLIKKGGAACVQIDRIPPPRGSGALRWLMTPTQLMLIGSTG